MKIKFCCPDLSDKRILYAKIYLEKIGYELTDKFNNADFILLGVNPEKSLLNYNIPIFAGNIYGNNIYDYTKNESFAIKNAYLTAEGAIALACSESDKSIINSNVLLLGYGRIAKALNRLLSNYTKNITICARSKSQQDLARCNGNKVIDFNCLSNQQNFDFIFNTVPHPVLNEKELSVINKDTLILDLASFPGGVDKHFAKSNNLDFIVARGLPAKYSPFDAGIVVAQTVDSMIKGGIL